MVIRQLEHKGTNGVSEQFIIQALTEVAVLNGKKVENQRQSDKIKDLARTLMADRALVTLEHLRLSLDRHASDVDHVIKE